MDSKTLVDVFVDRFQTGGSVQIECGYCGRVHFDTSGQGDFEEGELERLTAAADRDPDLYIATDGSVYWVTYRGSAIVVECPCNRVEKIARQLWDERRQTIAFLEAVAARNLATAEQDAGALGRLKNL